MLMGTYEHRLDAKARLVLPAKIREKLGDEVVVAAGLDRCVSLYSMEAWEKFLEKIENQPFYSNVKAREFRRVLMANAFGMSPDGAGRILVPEKLRKHASLTQDVVINGVGDHVEIWDRGRWADIDGAGLDRLSELAEGMEGF